MMNQLYGYQLNLEYKSTSEVYDINMKESDQKAIRNILMNMNRRFFSNQNGNQIGSNSQISERLEGLSTVDLNDLMNDMWDYEVMTPANINRQREEEESSDNESDQQQI